MSKIRNLQYSLPKSSVYAKYELDRAKGRVLDLNNDFFACSDMTLTLDKETLQIRPRGEKIRSRQVILDERTNHKRLPAEQAQMILFFVGLIFTF